MMKIWLISGFAACALALRVDVDKPQPFSKSSRLVVVGAGPAGIHMASRLKQQGYTNITLLEREHRVGGKSFSIYRDSDGKDCEQKPDAETGFVDTKTCVMFEMGTCFLHNGYHTIRNLVKEYGLTPEVAMTDRAMFSHHTEDQWHSQTMPDFVTSAIMDLVKTGVVKKPWWAVSETLTVMSALTSAVSKYNKLHQQIFGKIDFSMPDRLDKDTLQRINMTFREFLESHDLHALASFLVFAHAAQGYGYVSSIPAFYGLWWISPELLNGYIQMSMHDKIEECKILGKASGSFAVKAFVKRLTTTIAGGHAKAVMTTTTMLPEGYGKIWKTIHERDGLDVRFGIEIEEGGVDRQLDSAQAGVKVTFRQDGGAWRTEEFDFLLYTAPFASASKYVKDLVPSESRIFDQLQSYVLSTTLYQSDAVAAYSEPSVDAPIMYNPDKMDNKSMDGLWYADRNDPSIFGGDRRSGGQTRVGYQFFENFCEADEIMCDTDRTPDDKARPRFPEAPKVKELFLKELEAQRVGNVKILEQFAWPYFHHFPQAAVQSGSPWDLVDLQGTSKTWWLGASASFESVHDVTNYNLMIMTKYLEPPAAADAAGAPLSATFKTVAAHSV